MSNFSLSRDASKSTGEGLLKRAERHGAGRTGEERAAVKPGSWSADGGMITGSADLPQPKPQPPVGSAMDKPSL